MKYNLQYLLEQEDDKDFTLQGKTDQDIVLIPSTNHIRDVVEALENLDNYGSYASNVRTNSSVLQKAIEEFFGPSVPAKKKSLEKQRGKPFPLKTKQAVDDFIKGFKPKPNILLWKVDGNSLVFPKENNPEKGFTKKVIDAVMKKAGIDYSLETKNS